MSIIMYVGKIPKDIITAFTYKFTSLEHYEINDPIAALLVSKQVKPDIIITEAAMELLNGFSFSAIIAGYKENCEIFILGGNKANDRHAGNGNVNVITEPYDVNALLQTAENIFQKHEAARQKPKFQWSSRTSDTIEQIRIDQKKTLPKAIQQEALSIDYIFSPYSDFSGDCLDFWYSEKDNTVYGFLFDCTGHDVHSYSQVREMRTLFHLMFRLRRNSLNFWLQNVNNELFRIYGNDTYCTAAVTFEFNLNSKTIRYCSAGIPYFWTYQHGEYEQILMENFLIGCEPNCEFEEQSVDIHPGKGIIFCSDGLSELIGKDFEKLKKPQQDDISSIFINMDGGTVNEIHQN